MAGSRQIGIIQTTADTKSEYAAVHCRVLEPVQDNENCNSFQNSSTSLRGLEILNIFKMFC